MIIKIKEMNIFISFFLITISNSIFFTSLGINNIFEIMGYMILIYNILKSYIQNKQNVNICLFLCILFIFFIGILLQNNLEYLIKFRLCLSMFIIASISVISKGYISSLNEIRIISYSIFIGIIFSTILACLGGNDLFSLAVEGSISSLGFNGGLQHKNYFSVDVIAVFIGLYYYNIYQDKRKWDKIIMMLMIVLLFLSNSRGGYIIFIIFLLVFNIRYIKKIKREQRKILFGIIIFIGVCVLVYFYNLILSNSASYLVRIIGLVNFIDYYSNDWFYIIFGNAEMAFSNMDNSYNENVRSVLGWEGTTELAILSIFIKNGLIGFIGYILIFWQFIKVILQTNDFRYKIMISSVLISFIISSSIETYIVNMHIVYGTFCYIVLSGLLGMEYNERRNKK